jgi:tRNA(Ile)-lysidine synthase
MTVSPQEPALIAKLAAAWPVERWRDLTVLVAVSGGADSVALARALNQLRTAGEGRLVLAHYNHNLRGPESDADQQFVEAMARELGVEIIVRSAPHVLSPSARLASEESLRGVRYEFLAQAANQYGARYVATAHTADDQVETVLFNILRGTGLAGLAGIPRIRPLNEAVTLVRPLLTVTRAEVLDYLRHIDKTYRVDGTNEATSYTRNRIRHELLPLLEQTYNPRVRDAITRLAQIADEADEFVHCEARQHLSRICKRIPGGIEIRADALSHGLEFAARAILIEAWKCEGWPMQDMGYENWDELLTFGREPAPSQRAQAAPHQFPGGIRAEREGNVLRLTRRAL